MSYDDWLTNEPLDADDAPTDEDDAPEPEPDYELDDWYDGQAWDDGGRE